DTFAERPGELGIALSNQLQCDRDRTADTACVFVHLFARKRKRGDRYPYRKDERSEVVVHSPLPGNVIEPSNRVSTNVRPDTTSTPLAPGPPRSAVTVNGLFVPAPAPVTVADPVKTTVWPSRLTAVIGPVTYIILLSKLPLPCVPAGGVGMSA